MTVLLCRNRVADFVRWKSVFDFEAERCEAAGLHLTHLWRDLEDPNNVFFLLEVASLDRARAFLADPAGAAAGEASGVLDGEFHFLERGASC